MAQLVFTFQELYQRVQKFLGTYGSSGASGNALQDSKDVVHDAYKRFLNADGNHVWSFLKPWEQLVTISGDWVYELPSNFVSMESTFTFDSDENYSPLEERDSEFIMDMRASSTINRYPDYYALRPGKYTKETGQKWEVIMYPTPDAAYVLQYQYKLYPDKLSADNDLPIGGPEYSDVLKQLCLGEAESYKDEATGQQEQKAATALQIAISNDIKRNPHNLGFNGDGINLPVWDSRWADYRINNVTRDLD
jgi:hypothetical protein